MEIKIKLIIGIIVCIISILCICGGGIAKYYLEKARSEMMASMYEILGDVNDKA